MGDRGLAATAAGRVIEVERIGVAGAGTMGAGIAQLACLAGYETVLQDPVEEALATGERRVREGLEAGARRERWSESEARDALGRLRATPDLEALARCDLVIEAAPERLELKRELFAALSEAGGNELILATNTSSLPVSAIASATARPERVCGMHFFNPPVLMPLVEVVAALDTAPEVVEAAMEVGKRMGRTPIRAADAPGFLANRCARPFGLEALRLFGDGIAAHDQIDRICRIGAGFRMGPFELMDLVGIDVGFEVSKSFYEQSFHEPRWQPHPIQAQMAQSGRHGRKTGRGYYDYSGESHRPADPEPPGPPTDLADLESTASDLRLVLLAESSLACSEETADAVGFYVLPGGEARVAELVRGHATSDDAAQAAEQFFQAEGLHVEWVGDAPGGVLGRIVSQLVNEAAFALQRGIGSAEDIDTAMRLGFNWPHGPLEWGEAIGAGHVVGVLDALHRELGEERYRVAPLLRRMAAEDRPLRSPNP